MLSPLDLSWLLISKIFSFMFLGFIIAKFFKLSKKQFQNILKYLVIRFLFPVLIFQNILTNLNQKIFLQSVGVMGIAAIMIGLSYFLSLVVIKFSFLKTDKATFKICCTFHNYGFAVFPIVQATLGDKAMPLAFTFIVTCDAAFWALGTFILSKDNEKHNLSRSLQEMISAPLLTLFFSATIVMTNNAQYIDPYLLELMTWPAASAIPTALFCIGGIIFFTFNDKDNKINRQMFVDLKSNLSSIIILRHLAIPSLWILALLYLPFEYELKMLIGIEAVMPSSVGIIFLVGLYQKDTRFTALYSTASNLLSIITIPVLLALLSYCIQ